MTVKYDDDGNVIEPSTQDVLDKLEEREESSTTKLAEVLSNPQIQEVLAAQERGEVVKVQVGETKPPGGGGDEEVDLSEMNNEQLASHLTKNIGGMIESSVKAALEPVTQSITGLSESAKSVSNERNAKEYERLSGIYTNIDELKPKMISLHEQNPNLTMEQLAMVANGGKPVQEKRKFGTERPTSSTSPTKKVREKALPPGKQGFRQLLAESKGVEKALEEQR
jgi:hypothetical protein